MSNSVTVLVTGANRGIGRGLIDVLAARPNYTVIAAVRDTNSQSALSLEQAVTGPDSRIIVVKIESTSSTDPAKVVKQLASQGVVHLDTVIANSGICGGFARIDAINVEDTRMMLEVNTLAIITLFQAVCPLLQKSRNPKFVAMSSNASSIVNMKENIPFILGSYGMSKAAVNYLVRRIHFENDWLTAFVVHPGFVKTDMGNDGAKFFGMTEAVVDIEESVMGILNLVDQATKEARSGTFFSYDGVEMLY